MADAAGAGGRLVGVTRHSDFPREARKLPVVGDAGGMDFERIAALKPDLVLAWLSGNSPADVQRLEQLGYPAWVGEPRRLGDIPRHLRAIGALSGTAAEAERAAADFEREIEALRKRYSGTPRVRVFYEVWRRPLMTVGGPHLISEVMALCGGENVFGQLTQLTPTVGLEALLAAKPGVVLGGSRPGGDPDYARRWREQALAPLRSLPVFYLDPDLIQRSTPRILEGAKAVCAALESARRAR